VPSQAKVYLDGQLVPGATPTTIAPLQDDGFHELRFEKDGYETGSDTITPDDERVTVQATLVPERKPRGSLWVESSSIAEVWIDGVYSGWTTPTTGLRVPVGNHTVEVHAEGMRPMGKRIAIRQGDTVHLFLPLMPEPGLSPAR
jgi:hypothetical protein